VRLLAHNGSLPAPVRSARVLILPRQAAALVPRTWPRPAMRRAVDPAVSP
jgi:hypothetical protein